MTITTTNTDSKTLKTLRTTLRELDKAQQRISKQMYSNGVKWGGDEYNALAVVIGKLETAQSECFNSIHVLTK